MLHVRTLKVPSAVPVMKALMEMEILSVKVRKHYNTTWLNVRSHFLDIDECESAPCAMNAACDNTEGSFSCSCNEGFNGDGLTLCEGKQALLIFNNNSVLCFRYR